MTILLLITGAILILLCVFFLVKYSLKRSASDIEDPEEEIYDSGVIHSEDKGLHKDSSQTSTEISSDGSTTTQTSVSLGYRNSKSVSRNISFSIEISEILNIIKNREKDRYDVVYGILSFMFGFIFFFLGVMNLVLENAEASDEFRLLASIIVTILIFVSFYRQYRISRGRMGS